MKNVDSMRSLPEAVPDEDFLLSLETEELASYVLKFARRKQQHGEMLHLGNFQTSLFAANAGGHKYDHNHRAGINLAIAEAWVWLEVQGFLVPAEGGNGAHGFTNEGGRSRGSRSRRLHRG
jgi:hypothetical protein